MRFLVHRHFRLFLTCMTVAAVLLEATESFARLGGGHSYSGRSSSHGYGGGGGGGDGDLFGLVLWLLFRHPAMGITVLVIGGVCYFFFYRSSALPEGFSTAGRGDMPRMNPQVSGSIRGMKRLPIIPMLQSDPKFSLPLFLDFVSALAQRSLTALNTPAMANLEPYISGDAFARFPAGVVMQNVVVGSVTLGRMEPRVDMDLMAVDVSFCATAVKGDRKESFWFESEWYFSRQAGVVSKGPDEMLKLACPSCGATSDKDASGACVYCGKRPAPGSEAWTVTAVSVLKKESRPPVDLGSYAEEQGTYLATVYSPMLDMGLAAIVNSDHGFNRAEAEKTFRGLFVQLQNAWSNRDMPAIRPLVTDQLYRVYSYWIEAYRSAGIRNVISDVSITSLEIVAADVDPYFDSITARIAASMIDRCMDEGGKFVGGSSTPRAFSEYWTFIRMAGGKGDAGSSRTCSGCAASLEVGMIGECPYCGMLVSGKNFNWILSRIAQDEDYGT